MNRRRLSTMRTSDALRSTSAIAAAKRRLVDDGPNDWSHRRPWTVVERGLVAVAPFAPGPGVVYWTLDWWRRVCSAGSGQVAAVRPTEGSGYHVPGGTATDRQSDDSAAFKRPWPVGPFTVQERRRLPATVRDSRYDGGGRPHSAVSCFASSTAWPPTITSRPSVRGRSDERGVKRPAATESVTCPAKMWRTAAACPGGDGSRPLWRDAACTRRSGGRWHPRTAGPRSRRRPGNATTRPVA